MSSHDDQARPDRPAAEVLLMLAAGNAKGAERLLLDTYTKRLERMFMGNTLRQWTEEMISDTFFKFLTIKEPLASSQHAEPLLYRIAKTVVVDYARKANALSRGGGNSKDGPAEVLLDDEELLEFLAAEGDLSQSPEWYRELRDCVEKAMAFLRVEKKLLAEALWLKYLEYTPAEVAIYYGADPNKLTKQILGNARQRLSDACKKARPYFEPCKD